MSRHQVLAVDIRYQHSATVCELVGLPDIVEKMESTRLKHSTVVMLHVCFDASL
jgi:hypothetical protein